MRSLITLATLILIAAGCKSEPAAKEGDEITTANQTENATQPVEFGDGVTDSDVLTAEAMAGSYLSLEPTDTLPTSFEAKVTEVCPMKGCWMKLDLGEKGVAMVTFKDYGFFMPKDLAGKSVIVQGKAFLEMMSVEDQKHYARDGGASEEEIGQIETAKKTFAFEASGVRIK